MLFDRGHEVPPKAWCLMAPGHGHYLCPGHSGGFWDRAARGRRLNKKRNVGSAMRSISAGFVGYLVFAFAVAQPKPSTGPGGPLSPKEELATFRVSGFKVELVASEPDVIDPVAMAFDEEGRLYVAEMHGYPNKGVGTGHITSGKIKVLELDDK